MKTSDRNQKKTKVITMTALLTAIAFALQFIEVSIPVMPSFVKLDFSDLPEIIGAFVLGPVPAVIIALLKNLLHLPFGSSAGIGELSNFILGAFFSLTAGIIFKKKPDIKGAVLAGALASIVMGLISLPLNYFVIYPLYYKVMGFPQEAILGMYQLIRPSTESIFEALLIFNVPFTILKGAVCAVAATSVFKPLLKILNKA